MKAKYRQTARMYGKDHISNLTPAAFAAGFFFWRITFLFALHISLERKNPQKNKGF